MKDLFDYVFLKPFRSECIDDYIFGCSCWLFSLFILAMVICFLIIIIDSYNMPLKEKAGIVVEKNETQAYNSTTYIMAGKVLMPIQNRVEATYSIKIKIDELTDDVSLSKSHYDLIVIGQKFNCKYTNGRLNKSLYIKSLY